MQGTGLAFIAFTEAMTHFPASPFWSVMFFLMLINLGLGSMIGTMSGITTPIIDTFKVRKEVFTGEVFCIPMGWGWRVTIAPGSHSRRAGTCGRVLGSDPTAEAVVPLGTIGSLGLEKTAKITQPLAHHRHANRSALC